MASARMEETAIIYTLKTLDFLPWRNYITKNNVGNHLQQAKSMLPKVEIQAKMKRENKKIFRHPRIA